MYRIHFDPSVSMFVVQMMVLGIFWKTCKAEGDVKMFPTYGDACKWVSDIGLADAYVLHEPAKSLYTVAHAR